MGVGVAKRLGKKKEPKPKLLSPDIFCLDRGLPREGVGAKKFGMSFEAQGNQTFWRDIPGAPEKFEKKKVCVQFSSPKIWQFGGHGLFIFFPCLWGLGLQKESPN